MQSETELPFIAECEVDNACSYLDSIKFVPLSIYCSMSFMILALWWFIYSMILKM